MIPPLLTLDHARAHLKTFDAHNFDVLTKIRQSSEIVMNHLKLTDVPAAWFSTTIPTWVNVPSTFIPRADDEAESPAVSKYVIVPGYVEAALILQLNYLFDHRGDEAHQGIAPAAANLLSSTPLGRDPTLG